MVDDHFFDLLTLWLANHAGQVLADAVHLLDYASEYLHAI